MAAVKPTARDLVDLAQAMPYFPGAWSCVQSGPVHRETTDPTQLWMMFRTAPDTMATLWHRSGLTIGDTYKKMLGSDEHIVTITFFKASRGWFKPFAWAGEVSLDFDGAHQSIGCIAGRSQLDMWLNLRFFLDGKGASSESISAALATLTDWD